jgi:hypothetical protein
LLSSLPGIERYDLLSRAFKDNTGPRYLCIAALLLRFFAVFVKIESGLFLGILWDTLQLMWIGAFLGVMLCKDWGARNEKIDSLFFGAISVIVCVPRCFYGL